MRVATLGGVPRPATGKTPIRRLRVPDRDWDDLGEQATAAGTDRTKVLIALLRWWLRRPGAELPERPESGG